MGRSKKAIVGYWYAFSIHMGACRGPINALRHIKVGGLTAWRGETTSSTEFDINQPALFGGEEKEGGIVGKFGVWMGEATQTFSATFKALLGGLVPDFRGVTTFTYQGKVTANNPYPKPWAFRLARWDAGWDIDPENPLRQTPWYPAKARILLSDGRGGYIYAMNPAHILYECYTNRLWGRGHDPSRLAEEYFISAANVLCDEGFGLCLKWQRQGDISEFINTVLNHIGAVQRIDPTTGKVAIKLIRNDYDPENLVVFGYDTGLISIEEDETGGGDSAYSEVVVKYVDAATGEEAMERAHSLAIMQSLGDVASTTAAYPGIPTAALAQRVATRDLNQQAAFLKKFKLVLDRRGWLLGLGDVFKVTAADRGLAQVILRVGSINDSELKDGRITVTAIQDVFGLPETGYAAPQLPGAWMPPNNTAIAVNERRIEEVTYRDLVRTLSPADLASVDDTDSRVAIIAAAPTGTSINYDIASAATGEDLAVRGSGDWTLSAVLDEAVGWYDTALAFSADADLSSVLVGEEILVDDELMRVDAVDDIAKTIDVARGVGDTLPSPHAIGARVWFVEDAKGSDGRTYSTGEDVEVRLLTRTPSDVLGVGEAPGDTVTIGARQARPYPPGNLQINGTPFGTFQDDLMVATGDVVLTWAHRDRVAQEDQLVEHDAASVGPEAGTTYTVEVRDGATLLRTTSGVSGTTWTYDGTMISADGEPTEEAWTFNVRSVRGGLPSWQEYEVRVHRRLSRTLIAAGPNVVVGTGFSPTVAADWLLVAQTGAAVTRGFPPVLAL